MTILDIAYINYEHGGLVGEKDVLHVGDGYGYDHTGLVRIIGEDDRWPDLIVMGEGDRYEYWGGRGAWEAVEAMADAGGRSYAWLPCALPRDGGPFAPFIFYDPQTVRVKRFYSPHAPDFAARTRNLLIARPARGGEPVRLVPIHGDPCVHEHRTMDAEALRWLANEKKLSMIIGDFNEPLSGPAYEPTDMDDPEVYDKPWGAASKIELDKGRIVAPRRRSTGSLDFLCGWWNHDQGKRVNGVGFYDVCELAGINTPTDLHWPAGQIDNGRQGVALDHILVNTPLGARLVPGSVRVHEPIDPENPDSDHKRVSAAVEL